jgi:hypothetical protein
MRHITTVAVTFVIFAFVVGTMPAPVWADSPHFISASASVNDAGSLVASFKEAGLGTTVSTENITLNISSASATYACINGGGNHPKASNKETVTEPVTATGTFPVRNGQTTGSISAGPPGPGSFSCPSGQSLVLSFVSYTGVTLTGLAGDTANIAGTFTKCVTSVSGIC